MHKSAVGTVLRASPAHRRFVRSVSTLLEPQIRQLRPFDLPTTSSAQVVPRRQRATDPETLDYYATREIRLAIPRKRISKLVHSAITKALYAKDVSLNDIYNQYLALPEPRPLFLQHAELEQLLTLVISPALRDKFTIKRLLAISDDMRSCNMPLSIKEVNTLVYLVLRDKNWQAQKNPKHPPSPDSASMESMMNLLSRNVQWPVSTFNIALEICKGDADRFQELLDNMRARKVKWDATTAQIVLRHSLKAGLDPLETFFDLYSERNIGPQDINILVWGLLRGKREDGYKSAVGLVTHLSQFSTSDMTNAVRGNKAAFKAAKMDRKLQKTKEKPTKRHLESISDIPPTPLTDGTFSMLLNYNSSFTESIKTLKIAQAYFGEIPTKCLNDVYRDFDKHESWTAEDLYHLTDYVLESQTDYSVFTLELFTSALNAYKAAEVIERRGGVATIIEANCLEAVRLAKTDEEKQAYIYIYFRRLHVQKQGGQEGEMDSTEQTSSPSMIKEWQDGWMEGSRVDAGDQNSMPEDTFIGHDLSEKESQEASMEKDVKSGGKGNGIKNEGEKVQSDKVDTSVG